MADNRIFFYMQQEGRSPVSIEERFSGLRYAKCDGLLDKGKRKDVYIEKFADAEELQVWHGDGMLRDATTITLSLCFVGGKRQYVYEDFCSYVSSGKIYYWDTKRLMKAYLVLVDKIEPKEDVFEGSTPYIWAEFKFQNIWGECKMCDKNGNIN